MFHWITWKSYLAIGICTALAFFIGGQLAGASLIDLIRRFEANAIGAGMSQGLTSLFTEPLRIALEGNPIVCAVAGAVWPLTLLWLLLFLLIVVYGIIVPGLSTAGSTIR
jgi:hypothetical protein